MYPVVKYHESPYAAFANNPIWFIDVLGADTSITGMIKIESEIIDVEGVPDFVPTGVKLGSTAQVDAKIENGKFTEVTLDVGRKKYDSVVPVFGAIEPKFSKVANKKVVISEDGLTASISYDVKAQIADNSNSLITKKKNKPRNIGD